MDGTYQGHEVQVLVDIIFGSYANVANWCTPPSFSRLSAPACDPLFGNLVYANIIKQGNGRCLTLGFWRARDLRSAPKPRILCHDQSISIWLTRLARRYLMHPTLLGAVHYRAALPANRTLFQTEMIRADTVCELRTFEPFSTVMIHCGTLKGEGFSTVNPRRYVI